MNAPNAKAPAARGPHANASSANGTSGAVRDGAGSSGSEPTGFDTIARLLREFTQTRRLTTLDKWVKEAGQRLAPLIQGNEGERARNDAQRVLRAFETAAELVRATASKCGPAGRT